MIINNKEISKIMVGAMEIAKIVKDSKVLYEGNANYIKAKLKSSTGGTVRVLGYNYNGVMPDVYINGKNNGKIKVFQAEPNAEYNIKYDFGEEIIKSGNNLFNSCESIISFDFLNFNTVQITNMNGMFSGCSSLTNLDLSSFDTSNVTNMAYMFDNCESLVSLDLSSFDTSNVTSMEQMFINCKSLTSLDLSNFVTSKVTYMNGMFNRCSSLTNLDLSSFDTSNVTSMWGMFGGNFLNGCDSLVSLNLSSFDTSKITSMGNMFYGAKSLSSIDLSNFDTSKVTSMDSMFYHCDKLTELKMKGKLNASVKTDNMFKYVKTAGVFYHDNNDYTPIINVLPPTWTHESTEAPVEKGNYITGTLKSDAGGEVNLLGADCMWINPDIYINGENKGKIRTLITEPNVEYNIKYVFDKNLEEGLMWTFQDCNCLTSLDLSNFDTSTFTKMDNTFAGCSNLASLNLSNIDTSKIKRFYCTFTSCGRLSSLDLSNFNTSQSITMQSMFSGCRSLVSLDLSNFNTSQVTNMNDMFNYCTGITRLNLSNFNLSNVSDMRYIFYTCENLTELKMKGKLNTNVKIDNMFTGINTTGVFYHDNNDYTPIINALPPKWTHQVIA